ncbi:Svep1 [Symbiodinium natans]|uniref:Svep1 protein n=1 Tax=Symbiodinium natans TaxID=878477 RepID=A0A812JLK1_9DINO|nr:Svep1 [Symbiodinium natans]
MSSADCVCLESTVRVGGNCECREGYGFEGSACQPCELGTYKDVAGNVPCRLCQNLRDNTGTLFKGSTSPGECQCQAGYMELDGRCVACPAGFFCNAGQAFPCPAGATSAVGAGKAVEDCLCQAGYYFNSSASPSPCTLCPRGFYKENVGNDAACPKQCSTNANSAIGSTSAMNCSCDSGFYAEVDPRLLEIVRCIDCNTGALANMDCGGGLDDFRLYNHTGRHALPVAQEGFFQAGTAIALKCRVKTPNGSNACLGSQEINAHCYPNCSWAEDELGNRCAEGSEGFLCSRCPAGWARNGLQAPCAACQPTDLTLAASVVLDVSAKVAVHFLVASMAATAAVRNSGKLHTSMIRMATQWMSACSVMGAFDLDQLRSSIFAASKPSEDRDAGFPWPPEVQEAMRDFIDFTSVVGLTVSVQFALQCFAERQFPEMPASKAKNLAVGSYLLALPLLTALASVLLCALAVYLVVPCAKRRGVTFNEVGRRKRAKAKALKELHQRLDAPLQGLGLAWRDLEDSNILHTSLTALQETLRTSEGPSKFLQLALAGTPPLLLKALQGRARLRGFHLPHVEDEVLATVADEKLAMAEDCESLLELVLQSFEALLQQSTETPSESEEVEPTSMTPWLTCYETIHSINLVGDLDVDEGMDCLNFGLFHEKPSPCRLVQESIPVIWIGLISIWPILLSGFLQLLWCVPMAENQGDEVLRLVPSPDVRCEAESQAYGLPATLATAGLLLWCLGIPLTLMLRVLAITDRQAPHVLQRYGYFMQGYEPKFWYWDLLVKRLDVALMMLFTYTAIVPDSEAKLLLFPVLSGIQVIATAWLKPFINNQAEILDMLEVVLGTVRFILFSSVSALLILQPGTGATYVIAVLVLLMLVVSFSFVSVHIMAQFLRHAAAQHPPTGTGLLARVRSLQHATLRSIVPTFQKAADESVEIEWSFEDHVLSAPMAGSSVLPRAASFWDSMRLKGWKALRSVRAGVLRFHPAKQYTEMMRAHEDFTAFLLQEPDASGVPCVPSESLKILCALATASRDLPHRLAKKQVGKAWLLGVLAISEHAGLKRTCTPEELERAEGRLVQMPKEDAKRLIRSVARVCAGSFRCSVMAELEHEGWVHPGEPGQAANASALRETLLSEWEAAGVTEDKTTKSVETAPAEVSLAVRSNASLDSDSETPRPQTVKHEELDARDEQIQRLTEEAEKLRREQQEQTETLEKQVAEADELRTKLCEALKQLQTLQQAQAKASQQAEPQMRMPATQKEPTSERDSSRPLLRDDVRRMGSQSPRTHPAGPKLTPRKQI